MTALLLFYRTAFAEIAGACTKAKGLPETFKENIPLQLSSYRFYVGVRSAVEQYRSSIRIQDITHLLRGGGKRRTDQTQAIAIASELTF